MKIRNKVLRDLGLKFPDHSIFSGVDEVPDSIVLPDSWSNFGFRNDGRPSYPEEWDNFSDEFPQVLQCLTVNLLGTLVLVGEKVEMIYAFHDANGYYYYVGGVPVTGSACSESHLDALPTRWQDFYRKLHNGYVFLPADSMGPQRIEDQCRVSDLIDEEDVAYAESWITIFSNGGGDYVAIDTNRIAASGDLIWWHEEPDSPERGIDSFDVIDAWMAIFREGTDLREDVV